MPDERSYEFTDLGRLGWAPAFALQQDLVARRKAGEIGDQFLIVEHPHVVTVGRNGHEENLLASPDVLLRTGIELHHTDRGGDVTYHGPGQVVGYAILDLRDWKRDVGAYVRAIEQMLIDTLADFGISAGREAGLTGVWTQAAQGVPAAKIAAIGVHITRWVTSHGFALNVATDLQYFSYIVPCGLSKPVTSMRQLGVDESRAPRQRVVDRLRRHFEEIFGYQEAGFQESGAVNTALQLIGRV